MPPRPPPPPGGAAGPPPGVPPPPPAPPLSRNPVANGGRAERADALRFLRRLRHWSLEIGHWEFPGFFAKVFAKKPGHTTRSAAFRTRSGMVMLRARATAGCT